LEILKGRDHSEDLNADGAMTLKLNRVGNGFILLSSMEALAGSVKAAMNFKVA
jgi:hypothetical protein